jgi:hypothetical protein
MAHRARRLGVRILPVAFVVASCASTESRVTPPVSNPVVLDAPLPFRVGITRWEPGPLTDALALRLRKVNLFTEVYYPLESPAEMDAAIEFDVQRAFEGDPEVGRYALALLTLGISESCAPAGYRVLLRGELWLRVGERTLRKVEKSVRVYFAVPHGSGYAAAHEAADKLAGDSLAAQIVEELSWDPARLASDIASGAEVNAP